MAQRASPVTLAEASTAQWASPLMLAEASMAQRASTMMLAEASMAQWASPLMLAEASMPQRASPLMLFEASMAQGAFMLMTWRGWGQKGAILQRRPGGSTPQGDLMSMTSGGSTPQGDLMSMTSGGSTSKRASPLMPSEPLVPPIDLSVILGEPSTPFGLLMLSDLEGSTPGGLPEPSAWAQGSRGARMADSTRMSSDRRVGSPLLRRRWVWTGRRDKDAASRVDLARAGACDRQGAALPEFLAPPDEPVPPEGGGARSVGRDAVGMIVARQDFRLH